MAPPSPDIGWGYKPTSRRLFDQFVGQREQRLRATSGLTCGKWRW
jgi:hypothetical protein